MTQRYRVPLRASVLVDAIVEADSLEEAVAACVAGEFDALDIGSLDGSSWSDLTHVGGARQED